MLFKTKLFRNVTKIFYTLKKRVLIVQNSLSLALFSLFLGFLCGNLFGTFLDTLRVYFLWNGFVAFIILLFIETINFFVYRIPPVEKKKINLSSSNVQNSNFLPFGYNVKSNGIKVIRGEKLPSKGIPSFTVQSKEGSDAKQRGAFTSLICFVSEGFSLVYRTVRRTGRGVNRARRNLSKEARRKGRDVHFTEVSKLTIYIERSFNAFKIGLLFGFFIDSFKVGS